MKAIALLGDVGAITMGRDTIEVHPRWLTVAAALSRGSWREYGTAILQAAWIRPQVERALAFSTTEDFTQACTADAAAVARTAPQVRALLQWSNAERKDGRIEIPRELLVDVTLDQRAAPGPPDWVRRNLLVGARAERYSLLLERSRKRFDSILHVSRDSDRYGYDIEDRSLNPATLIEVKGSMEARLQFVLTEKELETARSAREKYCIHFWGEILLARHMAEEYEELRHRGYPLVVWDPAAQIDGGLLTMAPAQWRVQRV